MHTVVNINVRICESMFMHRNKMSEVIPTMDLILPSFQLVRSTLHVSNLIPFKVQKRRYTRSRLKGSSFNFLQPPMDDGWANSRLGVLGVRVYYNCVVYF